MPNDYGHEFADKELKKLESRLTKEYKQAAKEVEKKMKDFLSKFEEKDKKMLAKVQSGEMTAKEYAEWRKGQIMTGKRWEDMRDTLAQDLVNADKIAAGMINDSLPNAYAENMNFGTYEVESGVNIDTGFTLYDRRTVENLMKKDPQIIPQARIDIPKDELWNRRKLTSAVMQGILQGESIPNIAKRLRSVADMDRNAAIRNARTYTTAAENKGRVDSYERAKDMGIPVKQMWMATLDDRTRVEHRHLDGQVREIGEEFETDGYKIRYPGDPSAAPEMIYSCRCTLVADLPKYGKDLERNESKLGDMTYEEWKHAKDKPGKDGSTKQDAEIRAEQEKAKEEIKEIEAEPIEETTTNDERGKPNEATEYYVSGEGMWINQYLRGIGDFGDLSESEQQYLAELDIATDGNVKIDTLYRSVDAKAIFGDMSPSTFEDLQQYVVYGEDSFGKGKYADSIKEKVENIINNTEGKEKIEDGFMSTTKDKDIAFEFGDYTGSEMPVVLKIDTGGSVKGVDVSIYDKNVDESEKQEEVLLARKQNYIIERIYAENHTVCVDVKLVNDDSKKKKGW